jgi:hypothetical protein
MIGWAGDAVNFIKYIGKGAGKVPATEITKKEL